MFTLTFLFGVILAHICVCIVGDVWTFGKGVTVASIPYLVWQIPHPALSIIKLAPLLAMVVPWSFHYVKSMPPPLGYSGDTMIISN